CGTAKSHHSTGLSVSGSSNTRSGSVEAVSRRSPGVVALPLQLREASPVIEDWTGSQDASHAGPVDQEAAYFERHLLIEVTFCGVRECHFCALRPSPTGQFPDSEFPHCSLATVDDGSTALVVRARPSLRWKPIRAGSTLTMWWWERVRGLSPFGRCWI